MYVYGPPSSGKFTALLYPFERTLRKWCTKQGQHQPVSAWLYPSEARANPAGVYGAVLKSLQEKHLVLDDVSTKVAEAKQQLQELISRDKRNSSSSAGPMILLNIHNVHEFSKSHAQQLQQLFEMTVGSRLILIACGQLDLAQTLSGLQLQQNSIRPVQVEFKAFTESNLMALLDLWVGDAMQVPARELCAKACSGSANAAEKISLYTLNLALSEGKSCNQVTLNHMQQAVRLYELGVSFDVYC